MTNIVTSVITALLVLCEKVAGGLAQFGAAIGLVQNTEQKVRDDAAALVVARDNYEQGKALLASRREATRVAALAGRQFLILARDILKPFLGGSYSQAWNVAGYAGSLEIPRSTDGIQGRLQALHAFFVANPLRENAALNVTAVACQTLFNDIVAAQNAVIVQETAVKDLLRIRDEKAEDVRIRLRGVINELKQLIDPLDARWLSFGFNMPGAQATPDAPLNVVATLISPTAAAVNWAAAPRAGHYRVWKKVNGVEQELVAVGSPTDPNFTIEGLPANSTIEIAVSAVNSGGESQLSATLTINTH